MRQPAVTADLLHRFSPPPGLARSAPRDVRLTGGGVALTLVAWLLAVSAIAAGSLLYREASSRATEIAAIESRGIATTAVIDRVWRKTGDGKPAFAAFHFDAGGTRVHGETRMHLDAWSVLRSGSMSRVRYLEEDPHRWILDGQRVKRMPFAIAYVVGGALALAALLCGFAISYQRSLLMEGRVAPAVVTALKKHHTGDGASYRQMRYEFPLLGGGTATGKASASKMSAVGSTIVVLYDPDRPARNHPYPFSLVKPNES